MTDSMEWIESKLYNELRAVQPRPGFISQLRGRLISPSTTVIERPEPHAPALMILSGALLGITLYWLIRQAVRKFRG